MRKVRAEPGQLRMHVQRDAQRSLGVVFVCDRCPEEGEQRVACELLDIALIASDEAAESRDDGVDDLEQLLRVEAVGERGEPGDVGEKRRDEAPFLGELATRLDQVVGDLFGDEAAEGVGHVSFGFARRRLGFGAPRCTAMPAETHPLGVLASAASAGPVGHGSVLV